MRAYNKHKLTPTFFAGALTIFTLLSALLLSSPHTSADSSAGVNVSVTVPAMCSLTANPDTLSTTITPGNSGLIGTSTIKAICNDPSGLAVYAVGYTNDTYGNNNLATTVGGNTINIPTGIVASPTTSQWNMTINAVSGTYAPTIVPEFDNTAHIIPTGYTKVAYRNTMTDMGENATGANFTATFNAYIGPTQAAGTYTGKVKFTLVHPVAAEEPVDDDQIAVIYDGNGLTFEGGASENRVVYNKVCSDQYGYIGDTPTIIKTSNIDNDGTQQSGVDYSSDAWDSMDGANFEGATKIKLVVDYAISRGSYFILYDGNGYSVNYNDGKLYCDTDDADGCSGTAIYITEGSWLSVYFDGFSGINSGYDYGIYAKAYPIYNEEHEGATYGVTHNACTYVSNNDEYVEPTRWFGYWLTDEEWPHYLDSEDSVISHLKKLGDSVLGSTIRVNAYYPYTITYNGNQATIGTMDDFVTILALDRYKGHSDLLAPNFLKTGYGFAGWSESSTATVNSNNKIFGPSEMVSISDLNFNSDRTVTLYAVWVPSAGNIQNWNGCSSLQTNQVTALTDTRDGNTYAVAKLADGKCWIIENLRLDLADTNTSINADNTNNPTATFLNERTAEISTSTPRKGYCSSTSAQCVNQISFDNDALYVMPSSVDYYSGMSSGVFYNWYTATAGNGTYATTRTDTVAGDICPAGWHIPTGIINGDMYNLMDSSGNIDSNYSYGALRLGGDFGAFPINLLKTHVKTADNNGSNGVYYLSTAISNPAAGYFYVRPMMHLTPGEFNDGGSVAMPNMGFDYSPSEDKTMTIQVRCLIGSSSSNSSNNSSSNTSSNTSNSSSPSNANSSHLSMQSYNGQGMNYVGQTGTNSTNNEEDNNKETGNNSNSGNTAPLGVKKSSDEVVSVVTNNSSSDIYGAVAIAGAATLVGAGIFFVAKKKKDDEEEAQ